VIEHKQQNRYYRQLTYLDNPTLVRDGFRIAMRFSF
jgi:hypothetical protein